MKKILLVLLALAAGSVFAWDVEHDELAQLTGEFLPDEIRAQFDFDVLMSYCVVDGLLGR